MKKIGVISDTHLYGYDKHLEGLVARYFSDMDMIIHAGDVVRPGVLDIFYAHTENFIVVCGNMDPQELALTLPVKKIIQVEDVSMGIIHGWGSPNGIRNRIQGEFTGVDAIIYGHSHEAFSGMEGGIFFFNPGSPTNSRSSRSESMGILTIDGSAISGEIIDL
jgi:putative phosphoesterase